MPPTMRTLNARRRTCLVLLILALACVAAPTLAGAAPTANKRVAGEAGNATLGKTILVTTGGRTLYSLSAETGGRFVCTANCLTVWRPLSLAAGVKPLGPVRLGTIERPEGKVQVTYRGKPLYTFSGDAKPGQANGEGIKDVGTWHAAVTGSLAQPAPEPEPQPEPQPTYPY